MTFSFCFNSSRAAATSFRVLFAPDGQLTTHLPHNTHISGMMLGFPFSTRIALQGQLLTHL
jgi:hypothetical protein